MDFEAQYFRLFAAMADAVEALEENCPVKAREILIRAQQQGEDAYVEEDTPKA